MGRSVRSCSRNNAEDANNSVCIMNRQTIRYGNAKADQ
jgi:hypothetical protein